jgi:hypothetical protein
MNHALVVFESMWGNTEEVARAVADGLRESVAVDVVDVAQHPGPPADDVDLVVAGGPTHAFSMTRAGTRADARDKGARQGAVDVGLREWLSELPEGRDHPSFATFDTRVRSVRHLPGSAARSADRQARRHGYGELVPPESFWVEDMDGPLLDGELVRAAAWGRDLGRRLRRTGH